VVGPVRRVPLTRTGAPAAEVLAVAVAVAGLGAVGTDVLRPSQVISACICFTRRLPGEPAGPHGQRRCHRGVRVYRAVRIPTGHSGLCLTPDSGVAAAARHLEPSNLYGGGLHLSLRLRRIASPGPAASTGPRVARADMSGKSTDAHMAAEGWCRPATPSRHNQTNRGRFVHSASRRGCASRQKGRARVMPGQRGGRGQTGRTAWARCR
jgi:hypothetical protein